MENKKRLIDVDVLLDLLRPLEGVSRIIKKVLAIIRSCPTVDAVEMPQGKPGDYLEWDNGTGFKQLHFIRSVMICEDCMRYELEHFAPVVNHPGIVRIMSREEAERWMKDGK